MKETLFIVGGSGFVGKNMVRILHESYRICVYDKYIDESFFLHFPDVCAKRIELETDFIPEEDGMPDYLVNLAANVTMDRDLTLIGEMVSSNLAVLMRLFGRFHSPRLKLMVQFGSMEEYGDGRSPYKETDRESPVSPYALAKQLTTNSALMLYRNYGFPVCVVRPANLFGRFQNSAKFIPYVVNMLAGNRTLDVTFCEQKRDFLYVDDFVEALDGIMQQWQSASGEIINVGCGSSEPLRSIIEFCKEELHSVSTIHYGAVPYRKNETMDLCGDVSKLKRITGVAMKNTLYKRLKEYIQCDI